MQEIPSTSNTASNIDSEVVNLLTGKAVGGALAAYANKAKNDATAHKYFLARQLSDLISGFSNASGDQLKNNYLMVILHLLKDYLTWESHRFAATDNSGALRSLMKLQKPNINKLGKFLPIILAMLTPDTNVNKQTTKQQIDAALDQATTYYNNLMPVSSLNQTLLIIASTLYLHVIEKAGELKAHDSKKEAAAAIAGAAIEFLVSTKEVSQQDYADFIDQICQAIRQSNATGMTARAKVLGQRLEQLLVALVTNVLLSQLDAINDPQFAVTMLTKLFQSRDALGKVVEAENFYSQREGLVSIFTRLIARFPDSVELQQFAMLYDRAYVQCRDRDNLMIRQREMVDPATCSAHAASTLRDEMQARYHQLQSASVAAARRPGSSPVVAEKRAEPNTAQSDGAGLPRPGADAGS